MLGSIIVLMLILALLAYKLLVNKEFEEKLTFKNCTVSYPQYTLGERRAYEGYSVTNVRYSPFLGPVIGDFKLKF